MVSELGNWLASLAGNRTAFWLQALRRVVVLNFESLLASMLERRKICDVKAWSLQLERFRISTLSCFKA